MVLKRSFSISSLIKGLFLYTNHWMGYRLRADSNRNRKQNITAFLGKNCLNSNKVEQPRFCCGPEPKWDVVILQ